MNQIKEFSYRIRFKMFIKAPRSVQQKVMNNYSDKFSILMRHCRSIPLSPQDYKHLKELREFTQDKSLSEITSYLPPAMIMSDSFSKIVDVSPVFDKLTNDLKAYILLTAGVRRGHITVGLVPSVV